ncbi:MAG: hypothetical protein M1457_12330, partial [bacterium]|nr:hypothetical protein [bacterium]
SVRHSIWTMLTGGGHFIYHADFGQETVHTGIMAYDPKVPGGDTGAIRRAWLGHAARFFGSAVKNLDAMAPRNELAGEGCFCLAAPGREYVVYAGPASGATVRLDLRQAPGRFTCVFYDPKTGGQRDAGRHAGGAMVVIATPAPGDWVLHVLKE